MTMAKERDWNKVFEYVAGNLVWRESTSSRARKGKVAGCMQPTGYIRIGYHGAFYYAHRIIWEMFNGPIPEGMEIDQINHIHNDNRIENLSLATVAENRRNYPKSSRNTSGVTGVYWDKTYKKWVAKICVNHKRLTIGYFHDFNSAVAARKSAEKHYRFHKNHGVQ